MRLKKLFNIYGLTAAFGLFAILALTTASADASDLNIVTTTTDLASIAQYIVGDKGQATPICAGEDDPHFLEAAPSYVMRARRADLWIRVGMSLEIGWERPVIDGSRNRNIRPGQPGHLDASQNILRIEVPTERVTPAMGDVHPEGNPHYQTDPLNGRIVAETIAERLKRIAPEHSQTFQENLERFKNELDERTFGAELVDELGGDRLWALVLNDNLDSYLAQNQLEDQLGGWKAKMRPHRGQKLVTYHKNWGYFAKRFGLEIVTELEPKPGIPPSPTHLSSVVNTVNDQNIKAIIMAPFYSRRAADFVAERTEASVYVCPLSVPGTEPGPNGYFELIDTIAQTFSTALEG